MAKRRKHQIIFTHGGGRFANQLMLYAHLIAFAEDCPEISVCNLSFWPYAHLCTGTAKNPLCLYPPQKSRFESVVRLNQCVYRAVPNRLISPLSRLLGQTLHLAAWNRATDYKNAAADLREAGVRQEFHRHPWKLLAGWKIRDWDAFDQHSKAIRGFLQPAVRFAAPSRSLIEKLRQQHPTVVGLLMRQTDYRGWAGGKYFRSSQEYREIIDVLWQRFGPDAAILVTSDERQDPSLFKHPNIHWATGTAGRGHFMESFSQLGMCDVVVSVPSTFAAWAAFLGNTSLLCCAGEVAALSDEPIMSNPLLDARDHEHFGRSMFW